MTVKDCYEAIGADYQEVLRRLANEERVKRFLLKFPGDDSFSGLVKAVEEGDYETLMEKKGVFWEMQGRQTTVRPKQV